MTFETWFNQQELYGLKSERFYDIVMLHRDNPAYAESLVAWLRASYEAGRESLAQPEPWEKFCDSNCVWTDHHPNCKLAERLPMTDEEIEAMWPLRPTDEIVAFARAIEAKLKEKNT